MKMLDIFSKTKERKEKKKELIRIVVDNREKNSLVVAGLIETGVEIEFKQLPVADYIVNGVAVERKTVSDFISSMINKRLAKQLMEMQQYSQKILLIEGIEEQELYNDSNEGINGNAVRGFLLSIILEFQVPVILTKDYEDTAKYLLVLAKKKQKEHTSIRAKKHSLSDKEQLIYLLEGFPGIGSATAKKLLGKFKTIKNIILASEKEIKEVVGKKAEVITRLVMKDY